MIRKEDCVKIGYISKTHNLQGEVVVTSDNDLLEKYQSEPVFILLDGGPVPFFIADDGLSVRNHTSYIIKFDFVDSLEEAEQLVGTDIYIDHKQLNTSELTEEEYDIFDIVGFRVIDSNLGDSGKITDVADYSGNIVLTIETSSKEVLVPLADKYILEIDFESETVRTDIPVELIEL